MLLNNNRCCRRRCCCENEREEVENCGCGGGCPSRAQIEHEIWERTQCREKKLERCIHEAVDHCFDKFGAGSERPGKCCDSDFPNCGLVRPVPPCCPPKPPCCPPWDWNDDGCGCGNNIIMPR